MILHSSDDHTNGPYVLFAAIDDLLCYESLEASAWKQ